MQPVRLSAALSELLNTEPSGQEYLRWKHAEKQQTTEQLDFSSAVLHTCIPLVETHFTSADNGPALPMPSAGFFFCICPSLHHQIGHWLEWDFFSFLEQTQQPCLSTFLEPHVAYSTMQGKVDLGSCCFCQMPVLLCCSIINVAYTFWVKTVKYPFLPWHFPFSYQI